MFGFRCENSLFTYKDNNVADKFLNFFVGKTHRADIDRSVLALMKYIYWNTEYTIMLVIDDKNYTEEAKDVLNDLPFNQVLNIRSVSEVAMMLLTGEMTYYVDNCEQSRYKVQSKYAITSKDLEKMLRQRDYGRLT